MQHLHSFPSVYQLLPPGAVPMLRRNDGSPVSVFDDAIWTPNRRDLLAAAREVHRLLAQQLQVPTFALSSGAKQTDDRYTLDQRLRVVQRTRADGDGTVTCYSAYAGTQLERRHLVEKADHNSLCVKPNALRALKEIWANV